MLNPSVKLGTFWPQNLKLSSFYQNAPILKVWWKCVQYFSRYCVNNIWDARTDRNRHIDPQTACNLHKYMNSWYTYVREFTIAIGMPVGVLNAGSSLSAISIALFLNIYKQQQTEISQYFMPKFHYSDLVSWSTGFEQTKSCRTGLRLFFCSKPGQRPGVIEFGQHWAFKLKATSQWHNKLWCEAQQTPPPAATYRMILTC